MLVLRWRSREHFDTIGHHPSDSGCPGWPMRRLEKLCIAKWNTSRTTAATLWKFIWRRVTHHYLNRFRMWFQNFIRVDCWWLREAFDRGCPFGKQGWKWQTVLGLKWLERMKGHTLQEGFLRKVFCLYCLCETTETRNLTSSSNGFGVQEGPRYLLFWTRFRNWWTSKFWLHFQAARKAPGSTSEERIVSNALGSCTRFM